MNTQQIWQAVLGELELTLSKANFTTWFKGTFILEIEETAIIIGVPNAFTKSWLEKKYNTDILKALRSITEKNFKLINFKVASLKQQVEKEEKLEEEAIEEKAETINLNTSKKAKIPTAPSNDTDISANVI